MIGIVNAAIDRLVSLLAILGGLCLFAIAALILGDVIGRAAGLFTIGWKIDVSQYLLYLSVFLAAPWVLREGGHVSVDIVVAMMRPRAADLMTRAGALIGASCSAVLIYYSTRALMGSYASGTRVFRSIIFPEWYVYTPGPLIFTLMFLIFARAVIRGQGARPDPSQLKRL